MFRSQTAQTASVCNRFSMASSQIQPGLLRKMTVRKVLESLQTHGPLSRADLTRDTGISAPTVSKVVVDLIDSGLLEEGAAPDNTVGRPGKKIQLARDQAQVIGVVLDQHTCVVLTASLDGQIDGERISTFATPGTYDALLDQLTASVKRFDEDTGSQTLGVGLSTPGLVDEEHERCLFSPNLQIINHQTPAVDLTNRTGLDAVCFQETKALCMAERLYGNARGLEDFTMMDMSTGLGLGVFSGSELLRGHNGLAGELGHITVDPTGKLCGCGNHGCLETLATDSALTAMLSERLNQKFLIEDIIPQLRNGQIQAPDELNRVCEYLSIAVAAAINVFNPATLFLYGRFLSINAAIPEQVVRMARRRTLDPAFEQCSVQMAITNKQQGSIAAIVHHLTRSAGPRMSE
ncbi:MAG: ROK family transcriptional regulator [Fuerstiella sp.]|nr:ROK family transcriptional regulator [Fuerstiella sp.]